MRSVDRRTFLGELAAASAVFTAGAERGDDERAHREPAAPAPVWRKAPCRLCGVGCGLLVAIEGGRAVAVKGDPASPVGKGLACAKGYFSIQALYSRDRLRHARVRRDGALAEVPMAEALDEVARALRRTIARHGKDSVGIYGSAQWSIPDAYIATRFFKGVIGTNNVETSARLHAGAVTAGLISTFGLDGAVGCYEDVEHADVFVLWDIDLAETEPVLFSRMLERRRADPAVRIIDLATRTTRTSHAADRALLHVPHTTGMIANAICREIVEHRWVDRGFIERHVAFKRGREGLGYGLPDGSLVADDAVDVGWDEYVAYLGAFTPERAHRSTGLSVEDIRWLASVYGDRARRVMSVWGANASRHARGTAVNTLLYNIHLLVGKVATPGNAPLALPGQPGAGSAVHDAGALAHTLPRGVVTDAADRARAAGIWGVPATRIDPRPGRPALEMFRAFERGEIRLLWIQATNPLLSLPNLDRYRRAAERGDRILVVSEAYPTPTSEVADVVLPSSMWIEREGIHANAERRLQHFAMMLAPPGEAMSDGWQVIEVARRLGFTREFPWTRREHVARAWEEYRRFHADPGSAIASLDDLRSEPGVLWPIVGRRQTNRRFSTAHDPAADAAHGAFDFYGHADRRAWIWLRPDDPPVESPDRVYPYWFRTGPVLEHWGGGAMTQRIPTLHRAMPRAYLEMHRDDARALGVRSGDLVRLVSRRGAITIEVRLDFRSQPPRGQVFAPSFDEDIPVNRLMLDASDPLSGQPDTTACAVRIERLPRPERP